MDKVYRVVRALVGNTGGRLFHHVKCFDRKEDADACVAEMDGQYNELLKAQLVIRAADGKAQALPMNLGSFVGEFGVVGFGHGVEAYEMHGALIVAPGNFRLPNGGLVK